ncbi:MAG: hypothetical protein H3C34_02150 [Caldilineaceae bacterium]|nr:hypothetical protein [Caldilineaceae bacterium]
MSALNRLAFALGRRDEAPNQELARELVDQQDRNGIAEIVAGLRSRDRKIQAGCIKVLYEVGYRDPALIAPYVTAFFQLLQSRQNRLVWGGMIALSTIAETQAAAIFDRIGEVKQAMEQGSVITVDSGVKTLARVAAQDPAYRTALFPYLLDHLRCCRPKDVPQHAESVLAAVDTENRAAFQQVLETRLPLLSPAQKTRVRRVLKEAASR